MREIKFRAWDNQNSRMYYTDKDGQLCVTCAGIVFEKDTIQVERLLRDIEFESIGGKHLEIMQYTGLKDKNGKEIYEGDIVKFDNMEKEGYKYSRKEYIAQVKYWDFVCAFLAYINEDEYFRADVFNDCEVIGNIYENPELMI